MTTSASALPALPPNTDQRKIVERLNVLVRWFNRPDLFVPSGAVDTGSGAAYVTSPSTDIKVYEIFQEFDFKAANANTTTTPTLNVNGLGAGTISKASGALALGDIAANSFNKVIVTSTTPTFQLLSPAATFASFGVQTFLAADLPLNATGTVFNGPNTGALVAGTYNVEVSAGLINTVGGGQYDIGIHDGTNYLAVNRTDAAGASSRTTMNFSVLATIASTTTFTMKCQDAVSTASVVQTSAGSPFSLANKATYIKATRLA